MRPSAGDLPVVGEAGGIMKPIVAHFLRLAHRTKSVLPSSGSSQVQSLPCPSGPAGFLPILWTNACRPGRPHQGLLDWIEVFGRNPSFDAQSDPVVRIEAGRVRRALEHYYLTAGAGDPITIIMPKGGYVPTFTAPRWLPEDRRAHGHRRTNGRTGKRTARWPRRARGRVLGVATIFGILCPPDDEPGTGRAIPALEEKIGVIGSAGPTRRRRMCPRLLVMPFEDLSTTSNSAIVARGLTDEVIGQIAKFKEIVVIAGRSPKLSTDLATPDNPRAIRTGRQRSASKERNSA